MTVTVSVITPSYNQGKFIERTINSVLDQNISNLEYWIIDGGSTDETVAILKKYSSKLQWVSEQDKGQTDAVNKGLVRTTGEIIGWLNSDDIYYPGAITTVCDYFQRHPEVDVIYGDANHIDEHDQVIEKYYTEDWEFERLKEVCYLCQPAVFFRRSIIKQFGKLDENLQYCMDYEYWLRLGLNGVKFTRIPHTLAGSRLHQDTKTLGSRFKVHSEINDMMIQRLGKVPERWLSNYAHAVVEQHPQWRNPRWKFAIIVSYLTLYAGIRWNKWISARMITMTIRWIISGTIQTIKQAKKI